MSQYDDKQEVKRRESKVRLMERQDLETLGLIMSTKEGRRFVNWVLELCGIMKVSYAGPGRTEDTIFHEGQRNVGNKIFLLLDSHFPKEWLLMREEAQKEIENG